MSSPSMDALTVKQMVKMDFIDPASGIHGIGVSHASPEFIIAYVEPNAQNVPTSIMGIPVVKKITGPLRSFDSLTRPVTGGSSCGVYSNRLKAYLDGTVGMVVPDSSGNPLVLSNNHTFAGISTIEHPTATKGQQIWNPSTTYGGSASSTFATLSSWSAMTEIGLNQSDWGIATPSSPSIVSPMIQGIGIPSAIADPAPGLPVTKFGAFSGLTKSVYFDVNATLSINYEGLFDGMFDNVCVIDNGVNYGYGRPGDSGSVNFVIAQDGSIIATSLLFGGSSTIVAAAKMTVVQKQAGFSMPLGVLSVPAQIPSNLPILPIVAMVGGVFAAFKSR